MNDVVMIDEGEWESDSVSSIPDQGQVQMGSSSAGMGNYTQQHSGNMIKEWKPPGNAYLQQPDRDLSRGWMLPVKVLKMDPTVMKERFGRSNVPSYNFHRAMQGICSKWQCSQDDIIPEAARERTCYSLAMVLTLHRLACRTPGAMEKAHEALLRHRNERCQHLPEGYTADEETVPLGLKQGAERTILERPDGLSVKDAFKAWREHIKIQPAEKASVRHMQDEEEEMMMRESRTQGRREKKQRQRQSRQQQHAGQEQQMLARAQGMLALPQLALPDFSQLSLHRDGDGNEGIRAPPQAQDPALTLDEVATGLQRVNLDRQDWGRFVERQWASQGGRTGGVGPRELPSEGFGSTSAFQPLAGESKRPETQEEDDEVPL